jgi:hypothetical protein
MTVKGDITVTPSPELGAARASIGTAPGQPGAVSAGSAPDSTAPDSTVPVSPAVIAAEIQALRKGRGLRGDVTGRIGPLLRELVAGTRPPTGAAPGLAPQQAGGDPAQVRRNLAARLAGLAEALPGDLRMAILAALALHEATRDMRTYEQRKEWVARQVERVARTAERRIDEAQDLLAQEVARELAELRSRPPAVDEADMWYIERFSAVYLLDGDIPEAIERRVIRSNMEGLTELAVALDIPIEAGQPRLPLKLEMMSGGELALVEEVARTRTRYVIRLPRPLRAGEAHVYEMKIQVLPGGPLRDYYVFRPERRCDRFDLQVRFNRRRLPAWVRRIDGEDVYAYNTYDGEPTGSELVTVDYTGEAEASFTGLRQHFGSGLQWGYHQLTAE